MTTSITQSVFKVVRPGEFRGIVHSPDDGAGTLNPNPTPETPPVVPVVPPVTPPGPDSSTEPEQFKFTKETLKVRLDRQAEATKKELWTSLGVTNEEEAKAKLKKLDDMETERLSEAEKQAKKLAEAEKERDAYKSVAERELATRKTEQRDTVIKEAISAAQANNAYVDVVKPLVEGIIATHFAGQETVTAADLKVHMDKLKADKPALFDAVIVPASSTPAPGAPPAKPDGTAPKVDVRNMTAQEYDSYLRGLNLR